MDRLKLMLPGCWSSLILNSDSECLWVIGLLRQGEVSAYAYSWRYLDRLKLMLPGCLTLRCGVGCFLRLVSMVQRIEVHLYPLHQPEVNTQEASLMWSMVVLTH